MKEVVQTSAKKHIPKKRKKKQPWITKRTLNLGDERRSAKAEGNMDEWSRLCKEVTKSAREDKKEFIERKCNELESSTGDSKKMFQTIKELTKK